MAFEKLPNKSVENVENMKAFLFFFIPFVFTFVTISILLER